MSHLPTPMWIPVALVLAAAACRGPGPTGPEVAGRVQLGGGMVEPEFQPALYALQAAVDDGDEPVARQVLQQLFARSPEGRTLELALAFERILDGRAVVDNLDLHIEGRPDAEAGEDVARAWLIAESTADLPVLLRPGAATLRFHRLVVQPDGSEKRHVDTRQLPISQSLELAPREPVQVDLGRMAIPLPGGALAARCRITLELWSGELTFGERALPAARMDVTDGELLRLADRVPREVAHPTDFVALASSGTLETEPALELVVRIPRRERAETLELMAGIVEDLPLVALEKLVPALRWLAPAGPAGATAREAGRDPAFWRGWLLGRAWVPRSGPSSSAGLDLPPARRSRSQGNR